jgi:GT2 family glycosyltransferase
VEIPTLISNWINKVKKKIDIIVVNWNSGILTKQATKPYINCESDEIECNVVIVDNASDDNSVALLKNDSQHLIINKENAGFGKACNQAYENSDADYILLLNPDTRSDISTLENLTIFLEKEPGYAVTGPRQLDESGNIMRTCARFPSFKTALFQITGLSKAFPKIFTPAPIMTDWDHLQSRDVDHIMGSYMLIRKPVLDKIGFFDDDFFVYGEDLDLSKRIHNSGFKSFYNSNYSIYHKGGETGNRENTLRLFYSLTGRRIYWKKHFSYASYITLVILSILIEPFPRMINSIVKEKTPHLGVTIKAYWLYIKKMW